MKYLIPILLLTGFSYSYNISYDDLIEDHRIYDYGTNLTSSLEVYMMDYITKNIGRVVKEESLDDIAEIAANIELFANCFKIDPFMIQALITQESQMQKDAISPTYAVGLTQFTGIAIKDVSNRIEKKFNLKGIFSKKKSDDTRLNTKDYFTKTLSSCESEADYENFMKFVHKPVKKVKKELLGSNDNPQAIKNAIRHAAIYLKVLLASVDNNYNDMFEKVTGLKDKYKGEISSAASHYDEQIMRIANLQHDAIRENDSNKLTEIKNQIKQLQAQRQKALLNLKTTQNKKISRITKGIIDYESVRTDSLIKIYTQVFRRYNGDKSLRKNGEQERDHYKKATINHYYQVKKYTEGRPFFD